MFLELDTYTMPGNIQAAPMCRSTYHNLQGYDTVIPEENEVMGYVADIVE